jgi:hypothetical protein
LTPGDSFASTVPAKVLELYPLSKGKTGVAGRTMDDCGHGKIYAGLYYPSAVAAMTFVVGSLLLKETHGTKIWDEVEATPIAARATR